MLRSPAATANDTVVIVVRGTRNACIRSTPGAWVLPISIRYLPAPLPQQSERRSAELVWHILPHPELRHAQVDARANRAESIRRQPGPAVRRFLVGLFCGSRGELHRAERDQRGLKLCERRLVAS
jgi:hypothetical protein